MYKDPKIHKIPKSPKMNTFYHPPVFLGPTGEVQEGNRVYGVFKSLEIRGKYRALVAQFFRGAGNERLGKNKAVRGRNLHTDRFRFAC